MAYPIQRYANRYGIPLPIARALIGQESGGRSGAVSPVGATGLTQVMPSTAAGMYGITEAQAAQRLKDPVFALDAGFRYLAAQKKAFGSWRLALAAYNAGPNAVKEFGGIPPYQETQDYVRNILAKAALPSTAGAGVGSSVVTGQVAPTPSPATQQFDPTAIAQQNLSFLAQGSYDPLKALTALAQAKHSFDATAPESLPAASEGTVGTPVSSQTAKGPWKRYVRLAPGADRKGVSTELPVLQFVGQLGKKTGRRLTIGTGTNHNEYVVGTHRESAHWTGRAADIPATGSQLTRLGQNALILAGMSPSEARKQKGGLFNIGGYQIIFNSDIGGNHYNHLHVGLGG